MALRIALASVLVVLTASAAWAEDATRMAVARVRLTTDPKVPIGCTTLGTVDDNSIKDLRRKVVRLGGDTALLSFPANDLERMNAVVFRCPASAFAPTPTRPSAGVPPPPANGAAASHVPPPPGGAPPPPPPAGSAPASR